MIGFKWVTGFLAGSSLVAVTPACKVLDTVWILTLRLGGEEEIARESKPPLMLLHERHGVNLLAISRSDERQTQGLRDTRLRAGDVIILQGPRDILPERLGERGCLPMKMSNGRSSSCSMH